MNTTRNLPDFVSPALRSPGTVLTAWYGATASVRRLWAVEDGSASDDPEGWLKVMLVLEPTADGNETLPVWIANARDWAQELQDRTGRPVWLELVEPPLAGDPEVELRNLLIASESWRDPTTEEF